MKQLLIAALFLLIFTSCNDHKNTAAATGRSLDSAAVNSTTPDSAVISNSGADTSHKMNK